MKQEAESRLPGRQTLTSQLLETLGKAIVSEQFKGRSLPNEAEIAARYGASRSVTREAVKMLTAKGLLSARPRSGLTAQPQERWSLFDPDVLRWMLERKFSYDLAASLRRDAVGAWSRPPQPSRPGMQPPRH